MIDGAHISGGFGFQWHITDRCPGSCSHCYQPASDGVELPVGALKRIADDIMRVLPDTPVTINVTGGEPLLYQYRGQGQSRGAFELMSHLSTFDNLEELNIITSTRGMDQSVIHSLKRLPKLAYVKVSLESHDPLINDDIRGLGHFRMATENITALAGAGLQAVIMATLSGRNYKSVAGLCALSAELGARGVIFERFVPLGRGREMAGSVLAPPEWEEVLGAISGVTGAPVDDLRAYKAFWVDGESVSGAPCCLGPSSMALMPDGRAYPCRRVPIPVGKLPGDGMGEILRRLEGYARGQQKCFDFGF